MKTKHLHTAIVLLLLFVAGTQPAMATKYIKDDATGGDATSIGNWDWPTKTCTLTTDVAETIQINSNGITLEGDGHIVKGSGTGNGVYLSGITGVMIKNLIVEGFANGIHLYHSNSIILTGNMASNNVTGIRLSIGSDNFSVKECTFLYNGYGINIIRSHEGIVADNTFEENTWGSILSQYSNHIIFEYNWVTGGQWAAFNIRNANGCLVLHNEIIGAKISLLFSTFTNALVADNELVGGGGIVIERWSNNNIVRNNEVKDGTFVDTWPESSSGIYLWQWADSNLIQSNQIKNMQADGLLLQDSSNNTIENNEIKDNSGSSILELGSSIGNVFNNNELQ